MIVDEHKLFNEIEKLREDGEEGPKKIIEFVQNHRAAGKELKWFQTFIPELIPGTDSKSAWIDVARSLLWTDVQKQEHKRYHELLNAHEPARPPRDSYDLRKFWPAYVESLRPMSSELTQASNAVYRAVARMDCSGIDQRQPRLIETMDLRHHQFVAAGQVTQDLLVSPIIEGLEKELSTYRERISVANQAILKIEQAWEQLEDQSTSELDMEMDRLQEKVVGSSEEVEETAALKKALEVFRGQLLKEKEDFDRKS